MKQSAPPPSGLTPRPAARQSTRVWREPRCRTPTPSTMPTPSPPSAWRTSTPCSPAASTTGLNVCVECCDRHVAGGGIALDWESAGRPQAAFTFAEMTEMSARVANLLVEQGVKPGDVVAGMLPRTPELLATILGTWRAGAVYQPLFTAFGPKAIEHRLKMSAAKLVVTDLVNRPSSTRWPAARPSPSSPAPARACRLGDLDFRAEIAAKSADFEPVLRTADDLFLMMSTSGTTGLPKGVPVPLKALPAFYSYMRDAVDLRPDDIVLEHRRSRLGLRPVLRRHRPAAARPRHHLLRGAVHRREHLRPDQAPRHHQSRRRADRLSAADRGRAGRRGAGEGPAPRRHQRRRAAQPGGDPLVRRAPRRADPRPLRPDRARHGGQQPPPPAPCGASRLGGLRHARLPRRGARRGEPRAAGQRAGHSCDRPRTPRR